MTKEINKPELAIFNDVFVTFASQILNSLYNSRLRELLRYCFVFSLGIEPIKLYVTRAATPLPPLKKEIKAYYAFSNAHIF